MEASLIKNKYEISYLLKEESALASLEALLRQYGVEVSNRGAVAEMRLAYPIKKQQQAWFGYVQCEAAADAIEKIMESLKLNPAILRAMVITPPATGVREERPRQKKFNPELKTEPISNEASEVSRPKSFSGTLSNEALKEQLAALEGDAKKL